MTPGHSEPRGTEPGTARKILLTVYTAAFNEEESIEECCAEVRRVCESLAPRYDYEHIIGNNASSDRTLEILRRVAAADPRVRVLSYSRNFGAEKSGMTLLRHVSGDVAVCIPADMQEPPSIIPEFIKKWEEGNQIVYGVYQDPHETRLKRWMKMRYYRLANRVADEPLPVDFGGFALMDRAVVDQLAAIDDHAPYIRGFIATMGFRQVSVPYQRQPRLHGSSKHGWGFLFGFAANGIITHSTLPIRMATYVGVLLATLAMMMSVLYGIIKIFNWNFQAPGATTTIVLVLFFSGVQLFFLGVLGEYVAAIHSQVRRRPFVIIQERINFPTPAPSEPRNITLREHL